jgi:cation diffusion facilitator family transporter
MRLTMSDHDHAHTPAPGHDHAELASDRAFMDHAAGIRTVWLALAALAITSLLQAAIVLLSGSAALLADTLHNIGDGLNSIPLLIAFYLSRRAATRRYNYGYARAEDVAGVLIVLSIGVSAVVILWESVQKLIDPQPISHAGWVAAAAMVGFLGNEAVALLQIRVGRRIGSAALAADGLHARTDGLTSLAVLIAVAGSWLGIPILDPLIGLAIGAAILFITRNAALRIWYRLMDAIEPEILAQAEAIVQQQRGVKALRRLRMRWIGHRLQAEVTIAVDSQLSIAEGHAVGEEACHALFHSLPNLSEAIVHVDAWSASEDTHAS